MNQPDDDRVDPASSRFRAAVTQIAASYFDEAAIKIRRQVAAELEAAGWASAGRWCRKRANEIQANQTERNWR